MVNGYNYSVIRSKYFWVGLSGFAVLNILLYLFIYLFHDVVPFSEYNYVYNAHHFLKDPRIDGGRFDFLRALGQYDAQWYLRIAGEGYPKHPTNVNMEDKSVMDGLTYAFFPFYPIVLGILGRLVGSTEAAGFVLANLFLVLNFLSLYYLIKCLSSEKVAIKTIFLLMFFPLSIYFRSYFTEGLYLFLLIWFGYFLIQKRLFVAGVCLGLLTVTRGSGWLIYLLYVLVVVGLVKRKRTSFGVGIAGVAISLVPLALWFAYNFIQTGNALYFFAVRTAWTGDLSPFINLAQSYFKVVAFVTLPFHGFYYSKIDSLVILWGLILLLKSQSLIHRYLWITALFLWITPLAVNGTISFSRMQSVSFPLFFYLALSLKGFWYWLLLGFFVVSLYGASLFFVNWWWI